MTKKIEPPKPRRRFLRLGAVMEATGYGRTRLYELVASGEFPKPIKLSEGGHAVGWNEDEVTAWQEGRLNAWLVEDEGLGKIKFWAREFLAVNDAVKTSDEAPGTEAKQEVVEAGYSQGMEIVAAFLEGLKEAEKVNAKATQKKPGRPIVVTSDVCREIIKLRLYDGRHNERLESPATIRKVAKAAGWFVSKKRVTIVQGLPKAYLFASDPEWLRVTPGKLRENKGADVWFLETTLPE